MGASWPSVRFSDNGDGTFIDNLTGLVWLTDGFCLKVYGGTTIVTFQNALDAVANLADGQCGLSDGSVKGSWRIPNVNEASSLYDYANNAISKNIPLKTTSNVNYTHTYVIFTSTTYAKDKTKTLAFDSNGSLAAISKQTVQLVNGTAITNLSAVRNP